MRCITLSRYFNSLEHHYSSFDLPQIALNFSENDVKSKTRARSCYCLIPLNYIYFYTSSSYLITLAASNTSFSHKPYSFALFLRLCATTSTMGRSYIWSSASQPRGIPSWVITCRSHINANWTSAWRWAIGVMSIKIIPLLAMTLIILQDVYVQQFLHNCAIGCQHT